jgi:uncharacterized protein (DUF1330 family)
MESVVMAAYIVSVCDIATISDALKEYAQRSADLAHRHGGRYTVRGKPVEVVEGEQLAGKSLVILEFPTMEQLRAYLEGDEYQKAVKPLRTGTGIYDIGIYESPPPAMQ